MDCKKTLKIINKVIMKAVIRLKTSINLTKESETIKIVKLDSILLMQGYITVSQK